MCIYIDTHIYDENPDFNIIFNYMYCIAYMLASKAKYFIEQKDYEEFASLLAYSTFKRYRDPKKAKLKSVLNYMKSIMYFRKCYFERLKHQEIIDVEYNKDWDPIEYTTNCKISYEKSNHERTQNLILDLFNKLPKIIKYNIPLEYKTDKSIYSNLYISCLLSLVSSFTLPSRFEKLLNDKCYDEPSFNEIKFYKNHLSEDIILWHLPISMTGVIKLVINKVNNYLISEIKDISSETRVSDLEFNNIFNSAFNTGGSNNYESD